MSNNSPKDSIKREFLTNTTIGLGVVGVCSVGVAMIDSLNPSADVVANASIEVDVSALKEGDEMKVLWRGKPIFIKRRTREEIESVKNTPAQDLKDYQRDEDRVKKEEFLVVIGVCTHLGCVPKGGNSGDYKGWFCPCHGSHYDASGRVRKGPAPLNLAVPPYQFISDSVIKIG